MAISPDSDDTECVRCRQDKHIPKVYSSSNNMDSQPYPLFLAKARPTMLAFRLVIFYDGRGTLHITAPAVMGTFPPVTIVRILKLSVYHSKKNSLPSSTPMRAADTGSLLPRWRRALRTRVLCTRISVVGSGTAGAAPHFLHRSLRGRRNP